MRFEPLEPRLLLAADLSFLSANDLTLEYEVSGSDEIFRLTDTNDSVVDSATSANWTEILIEGSADVDTLRLAVGIPSDVVIKFKAGGGNDTLVIEGAFDVFGSG